MANLFQQIQLRRPRTNKFNLSHERKMTLNMGDLVPCYVQEIVPGDKFRVNTEMLLRFQPLLAPIMHNVNVYVHYFFVPNRIVFDEWEDFITGGREGTANAVAPYFTSAGLNGTGLSQYGTLADYLGLPVIGDNQNVINISALPFRAYQLIWDEYFRDQNLSPSLEISKASGLVSGGELNKIATLRKRAWEKDYFTSALPWAQRGPEVLIPMEGEGSVTYLPESKVRAGATIPNGNLTSDSFDGGTLSVPAIMGSQFGRIENIDEVNFDNTNVTINELRRSVKLQEWLEKSARAGARYAEQLLAFFGVRSSDARLQRPEFLGGGRTPVRISEVLSTFQDPDLEGNPQANMAGHGLAFGGQSGFRRFFEEHGYVIGLMSVLPRTAYQQGVPRHFSRSDRYDYYWPEFAHIGEQEIRNKELFYHGTSDGTPDGVFGYQSRYAEYKYGVSSVHGQMRDTLDFWHMGRKFSAEPQLNESFVMSNPTDRIFAVQDTTDQLIVQLYNRVDALRRMPYFGTPTL